jgi:hypothetical protein
VTFLISASQGARIISVSHQCPASENLFDNLTHFLENIILFFNYFTVLVVLRFELTLDRQALYGLSHTFSPESIIEKQNYLSNFSW